MNKISKFTAAAIGMLVGVTAMDVTVGKDVTIRQAKKAMGGVIALYDSLQDSIIVHENEKDIEPFTGRAEYIGDIPERIFNRMYDSVVRINFVHDRGLGNKSCDEAGTSCGTGTVIYSTDTHSYILTNKHIGGASLMCGQMIESPQHMGLIKGSTVFVSTQADLALIRAERPLRVSPLSDKPLSLHDTTAVVGCPWCLEWFTDIGFVSKENQMVLGSWAEQLASHTYPGNSGSPVFNMQGELSGVIFAGIRGMHNIGYNIPWESVMTFLSEAGFPDNLPTTPVTGRRILIRSTTDTNQQLGTPYFPLAPSPIGDE